LASATSSAAQNTLAHLISNIHATAFVAANAHGLFQQNAALRVGRSKPFPQGWAARRRPRDHPLADSEHFCRYAATVAQMT
jgi:hypothetical protein